MAREQRRNPDPDDGQGLRGTLDPEEGAFVQIPGTAGAVRLRALPPTDEEGRK